MISGLDNKSSGPSKSSDRDTALFLDETLYSDSASFHPSVKIGIGGVKREGGGGFTGFRSAMN